MGNNSVEGFNRTSYIADGKAKWIGRKVNGITQIEVWRGKVEGTEHKRKGYSEESMICICI